MLFVDPSAAFFICGDGVFFKFTAPLPTRVGVMDFGGGGGGDDFDVGVDATIGLFRVLFPVDGLGIGSFEAIGEFRAGGADFGGVLVVVDGGISSSGGKDIFCCSPADSLLLSRESVSENKPMSVAFSSSKEIRIF